MNAGWIIPFIIVGGALQTCGAAMNGQLGKHLVNPWLASAVSFSLITFFFIAAFFILPHPLPTGKDLATLPWWAVIGGLVGAVQVYAGLTLVNKVGAARSWDYGDGGADYVAGDRPLWVVPDGSSPDQSVANNRGRVAGGWGDADCKVLNPCLRSEIRGTRIRPPAVGGLALSRNEQGEFLMIRSM